MAEAFKLIYRGEVAPDQHPAVVRGRLQKLLKTTGEQAKTLMSGEPVVVQRAVDQAKADKYQQAFAGAGAVLEVVAVGSPAPSAGASFSLAAVGTDLLSAEERGAPAEPAVALEPGRFSLAFPGTDLQDPQPEAPHEVPDVSHLSVDAPGAALTAAAPDVPLELPALSFELQPAGEPLGNGEQEGPAGVAPDVSHLQLATPEP